MYTATDTNNAAECASLALVTNNNNKKIYCVAQNRNIHVRTYAEN